MEKGWVFKERSKRGLPNPKVEAAKIAAGA
jgi:hypothetical protein